MYTVALKKLSSASVYALNKILNRLPAFQPIPPLMRSVLDLIPIGLDGLLGWRTMPRRFTDLFEERLNL